MSIYLTMTLNNINIYSSLINVNVNNDNEHHPPHPYPHHKYIYIASNLDYLQNKRNYNKYLNKFLDKCQHFEIRIYDIINNKYHILNKKYVIDQINDAKKYLINNHILALQNLIKDNLITADSYSKTNSIVQITHKMLVDLDKLIKLTDDVYSYNLLCIEDSIVLARIDNDMYVDVSEINDDISRASKNGYIDEYK
jgi:hypothetical protein